MMTIILISGVAAIVSVAAMALAMGRAAAIADDELDELLARRLGTAATRELRESYAGLDVAQATISLEPSITEPSSSTSAGTQRFPVSSWTSRRPRVWLNAPGNSPSP